MVIAMVVIMVIMHHIEVWQIRHVRGVWHPGDVFCHFRNHYRVDTNTTDFPASVVFCSVPEHELPPPRIVLRSVKSVDSTDAGAVCFVNGVIELE